MVTRAKRANNNKWDAANMTVLGCKIRKDKAEEFKTACKLAGTTPNAVFRAAAEDLIEQVKAGHFPAPGQQEAQEQGEEPGATITPRREQHKRPREGQ